MYKIIFSVNNNEEVWTLPHCPPVDSFDVTVRRNGDLEYSIAVTEYRFIK